MKIYKLILLCAGLFLAAGSLLAFPYDDKNKIRFGKVDKAELEMTSYEVDTGAAAVILADIGSSSIEWNQVKGFFEMVFERHCRIKIMKNTGYDYANIEIPVYNSTSTKQYVSNLKAFTYNLDNGKIAKEKLSKKSTFEEKYSENWNLFKFTFPNVKEGSVIEFSFRITSDWYTIRTWEFQKDIPVMWSEYTVKIPEYFNYLQIGQGYEPFYKSDRKRESRSIGSGRSSQRISMSLRVAAVSNVSIVSIAALIGVSQLGSLFTQGFNRNSLEPIVVGVAASVVLALTLDVVIALVSRLLTPWLRAGAAR